MESVQVQLTSLLSGRETPTSPCPSFKHLTCVPKTELHGRCCFHKSLRSQRRLGTDQILSLSFGRSSLHLALLVRQELRAGGQDRRPGRRTEGLGLAQRSLPLSSGGGVEAEGGVRLLSRAPLHLLLLLLRHRQQGGAALLQASVSSSPGGGCGFAHRGDGI